MSFRFRILSLVILFGGATAAHASDGVLEIHQACVAGGCFSGDNEGFPVTLTAGNSYRLTSNITVPDASTTAIQGNDVQVDLNGFTIQGPVSCSGAPAVCDQTGSGHGISGSGITVLNGVIHGMGGNCIRAGNGSEIRHVRLEQCGVDGVQASIGSIALTITENRIHQNGGIGVHINFGGTGGTVIKGNSFYGNGAEGIRGNGSMVLDNTFYFNGSFGLNAGFGGSGTAFGRNTFVENNGDTFAAQTNSGTEIAPNLCGGNTTCP